MSWLKKRRIARLEVKLAGAVAADRVARELANVSGIAYPVAMAINARDVAEIEEKLKQLRGAKCS